MAWGQEKGADFHISALRACQYEIFDFVPCSLPLKTLILLTFSCFLIRRRGREELLYEVPPFGFYNPPEWVRRMNSIQKRAKEMEKSF